MNKETLRMQMLAGIITESQYIQKLNESDEEYLNSLLEKIFDEGISSLTPEEKQYLDDKSQGKNNKTPNQIIQDLFNDWKKEEIESGNDIENIYDWNDLHKFDQELQDGFISYVNLINKYPNLDKQDLALVNSLGHAKEFDGTPIYMPYSDYDWNSLDEQTYHKIIFDEFDIEPYEDEEDNIETDEKGNISDKAYIKEFGYSWKEKQNWEKILAQVEKKYNYDAFDVESLKNSNIIQKEAAEAYIKKYGPPKYKQYPFYYKM